MLTIHGVPPGGLVLAGRLITHRLGRIKGRPSLSVEWWCPHCRDHHAVEWDDPPFPIEAARPVKPPCPDGPFSGATAWATVEDNRAGETWKLIRHFSESLRRWKTEQRLRHQFSEARAIGLIFERVGTSSCRPPR